MDYRQDSRQSLALVTAPACEPISLDEVVDHLKLSSDERDAEEELLTAYIVTARQYFERSDDRRLITQTWKLFLDCFPYCEWIDIFLQPVQSITSIKYIDGDGNQQTWNSTKYQVDLNLGRVMPAYGEFWPLIRPQLNAVEVTFVVGYGNAAINVPREIRTALLLLVGELYKNREHSTDQQINEVPFGYKTLISPGRNIHL